MIKFLQTLWAWISDILFPDEYYSWQTLIYLGIFSFVMSWVARLAVEDAIVDTVIATAGWIFFALGIGWLLDKNDVTLFGIPLAPWVIGAIVCAYLFGTFGGSWQLGLMTWPLVSVAIAAIPQFLDWELNPQVPEPKMRQQLILLTLIALLLSNWFQFYFRLQEWFEAYPSLLADDFSRSGFVFRLSETPAEQAQGIALLTYAQTEIRDSLGGTPWPYVERWLLNLDDKMTQLEQKAMNSLDLSEEDDMWQLQARRPRTLNDDGYALDLMAIWSGPASIQNGYYLEKTCLIQPQFPPESNEALSSPAEQPTPLADVQCDLATPKRPGKPTTV